MIGTEEKDMTSIIKVAKEIHWTSILLCILGFWIGKLLMFDTFYTLGICYIGALYYDKELRKWSPLVGVLALVSVGLFDEQVMTYLLMIVLLVSFRGSMRLAKISMSSKNQAIITGIAIGLIKLIGSFITGITTYKLLVSLLEGAIGAGVVIVLGYGLEIIYKKRKMPLTEKSVISIALLLACMLGGMTDLYVKFSIFNRIYLRDVITFIILIAATYLGGMNSGVLISFIISSVLVVIGYMPAHFVAIYMLGTLMGALFKVLNRMGVMIAIGLGLLFGFAIFNDKILDWSILGAYVVAVVVSMCLPRQYFGIAAWFEDVKVQEQEHLMRIQALMTRKLNQFSGAFRSLSSTFNKIMDKQYHLSQKDIRYIIEDTGECMCAQCSMKNFCWDDYIEDTYKSGFKMLELIEKKGHLTMGDIPESFKKACLNAESFAYTLSFKLDLYKQNMLWKNRFVETRHLVCHQFEALAESVGNLSSNIEKDYYFNREDEEKVREYLMEKGLKVKDIIVLENSGRKEGVHLYVEYKGESDQKEKLVKYTSEALGIRVELERMEYHTEEKYCYYEMVPKKKFTVVASSQMQAKECVSGDAYSIMALEDGHFLLALADGMGSGKLASAESTATIELFEKLRDSGFESNLAIKMINSILVLKSDIENFSTMDITLIDEYTGVAEFLKMGAATSFLLRDGAVSIMRSSSLPIGMLEKVDIETYREQLKDGDIIIMVTDGMLEGGGEILRKEDTFKYFILEAQSNNTEYLAKYLMQKSKDLLGVSAIDDMTIIVARVMKQY